MLAREVQVHAPVGATTRPRCSACCARRSRPATSSASAAATARSSPPARSCWSAARACAPSTLALAGSTRRSADPAVDDHLGEQLLRSDKDREEQAIVARRIARALRRHTRVGDRAPTSRPSSGWPTSSTSRRRSARSSRGPFGAVELAGLLHPTPAVGGEPLAAAAPLIPALEGLDRGWYAGPVGWTDAQRGRRVLRRAALRAAARRGGPLLRRRRRRRATPTRRPSWPRPRSSCRRCCRSWRAERRVAPAPRAGLGSPRCPTSPPRSPPPTTPTGPSSTSAAASTRARWCRRPWSGSRWR